jgi:hypothetical protein
MSLVSLVWVGTLGYKFNSKTAEKTQNDIKPFALFGQTLSNTYNSITASVGNISSLNKEGEKKVEVKNEKVIDLIPVEHQ